MYELKELGIEVEGAALTTYLFKELLHIIDFDKTFSADETEEVYMELYEIFPKIVKMVLRNKVLLLWSDPDFVSVHILESSGECKLWIRDAERLFKANPIPDSDDPQMDDFVRQNRFAREITFEQFAELAGDDFSNPDCYRVDETGLTFAFENTEPVYEARANGKI